MSKLGRHEVESHSEKEEGGCQPLFVPGRESTVSFSKKSLETLQKASCRGWHTAIEARAQEEGRRVALVRFPVCQAWGWGTYLFDLICITVL